MCVCMFVPGYRYTIDPRLRPPFAILPIWRAPHIRGIFNRAFAPTSAQTATAAGDDNRYTKYSAYRVANVLNKIILPV